MVQMKISAALGDMQRAMNGISEEMPRLYQECAHIETLIAKHGIQIPFTMHIQDKKHDTAYTLSWRMADPLIGGYRLFINDMPLVESDWQCMAVGHSSLPDFLVAFADHITKIHKDIRSADGK